MNADARLPARPAGPTARPRESEPSAAAGGDAGRAAADDPAAGRPFYRLLGLRSEPGLPAGTSRLRLAGRPELQNSHGDIHGGVVATLLDAAMGVAARSAYAEGQGATTVSMTVNYLEPGRDALVGEGRLVRGGRTLASLEARVVDGAGRTVAHAVGTMRIIARRG